MVNVIICKSGHGIVTVVIVRLESDVYTFLLADFLCCSLEVLRQQLTLFVEVVTRALCLRI